MKSLWCILPAYVLLCSLGCGSVTWRNYYGPQDWATGAGFSSKTKDGLLIYEGLPERPYTVLGIVEAQGPANFIVRPAHRKKMHEMIREHGGDGMIIIGREIVQTGSSGSYQGHAYASGNAAYGHGTSSSTALFNYALAVLAIRTTDATARPTSTGGRDPVAWAQSVLAGGTAVLGAESGK